MQLDERDNSVVRLSAMLAGDASIPGRARRAGETMLENGKLCCYGTNTEIAALARMSYSSVSRSFRDLSVAGYGKHHTNRDHQSVWLWHAYTKLSPDFNELTVGITNQAGDDMDAIVGCEQSIDCAMSEIISTDYGTGLRVSILRLASMYADAIIRRGLGRVGVPEKLARKFGDTSEYSDRELRLCLSQVDTMIMNASKWGNPSLPYWRAFRKYLLAELALR